MHLRRRVVDGDAAGFFLLLLFRIVGRQVGRDAIPGLPAIARAEQELRSNVNCPLIFLVGAHVDWRVPVEAQLLLAIIRPGFKTATLVGMPIYAAYLAALRLGVNVVGIGSIFERPETITAENILPV